ncbi:MAG: hypothetical protein HON98_01940 [Chloroflexi bacterium]|jgi:hypothetical protein|nr:hypothetical protein [Chloroflexota bacterium]MBT3670849.1 hypothetical protein [Chloroflexota bacterium]MBT4004327.1 hypothetical protein [Chloroflexota bacterium]MBT4305308.1 hypothetical protein [Chloroflexota bacterium]MBT4532454.1 hypothetical protein [Chloroflexota bacterium]
MKTQILHIEPYDDTHSIKDKMNWAKSDRILLVFPHRRMVIDRKIDLLLIQRHATSIGAQIALVTKQEQLKSFAAELEIPIFRSLRIARRLPWEAAVSTEQQILKINPPEKSLKELKEATQIPARFPKLTTLWARLLIFSTGVLAFTILLAALLPRAEIRLSPESEKQEMAIDLIAKKQFTSFGPAGILPAIPLKITVEGRDSLQPSGSISVPQQAAEGEIQFTNLTNQEILIPEGTVVRTIDINPIRFATLLEVQLPAESGATGFVEIRALNPGNSSNLAVGALIVVEGDLGLEIASVNLEPTSGGSELESTAPTPGDYEELSDQLEAALWESAIQEAKSIIEEGDFLIITEPNNVIIKEEVFSPSTPQPVSELSLQLQIEYEILYISGEDLKSIGLLNLDALLSDDLQAKNETLLVLPISVPEFNDDDQVYWRVLVQRQVIQQINTLDLKDQVKGKSINVAIQKVSNEYDLSKSPNISIFPNWWPWLPVVPLRITVDVE